MDDLFINSLFSLAHRTTYHNFSKIMLDFCLKPPTLDKDVDITMGSWNIVFLSYQMNHIFKSIEDIIQSDYKYISADLKETDKIEKPSKFLPANFWKYSTFPHSDEILIVLNPELLKKYKYFFALPSEVGGRYNGIYARDTYTSDELRSVIIDGKKYDETNEYLQTFIEKAKNIPETGFNDPTYNIDLQKKIKYFADYQNLDRKTGNYMNEICIPDIVCFKEFIMCFLVELRIYKQHKKLFKLMSKIWDVYITNSEGLRTIKYKLLKKLKNDIIKDSIKEDISKLI